MPTSVGILTLLAGKISCSAELSIKFFITSEPGLPKFSREATAGTRLSWLLSPPLEALLSVLVLSDAAASTSEEDSSLKKR